MARGWRAGGASATVVALVTSGWMAAIPATAPAEPLVEESSGVVVLESLPGATRTSVGDILDCGTIVGYSGERAVRWDSSGRVTMLDSPGDGQAIVRDASESGFVVGYVDVPGGSRAVRWGVSGAAVFLPVPAGTQDATTFRVNESGMVFGMLDSRAALWDAAGRLVPLELPPGVDSIWPTDMNEKGATVAVATYGGTYRSLRWDRHGKLTGVSPLGIQVSDLNNNGVAIGRQADWPLRAIHWERSGRIRELSAPNFTWATRINDRGAIVGMHYTTGGAGYVPVAWNRAGRYSKLELPPGFTGGYPGALNESGTATGMADVRVPGGSTNTVVRWDPAGHVTVLPVPAGTRPSYANHLNRHGAAIGTVETPRGNIHAVYWPAPR